MNEPKSYESRRLDSDGATDAWWAWRTMEAAESAQANMSENNRGGILPSDAEPGCTWTRATGFRNHLGMAESATTGVQSLADITPGGIALGALAKPTPAEPTAPTQRDQLAANLLDIALSRSALAKTETSSTMALDHLQVTRTALETLMDLEGVA